MQCIINFTHLNHTIFFFVYFIKKIKMVKKRQKILNSIKKAIIKEKLMTDKTYAKIAEEFNIERSTVTKI